MNLLLVRSVPAISFARSSPATVGGRRSKAAKDPLARERAGDRFRSPEPLFILAKVNLAEPFSLKAADAVTT